MSTLWIILISGFLVATDYTISKSGPIHLDLKHDPKLKREVIYFDRVEYQDGCYLLTKDSIVNYYKRRDETLRQK